MLESPMEDATSGYGVRCGGDTIWEVNSSAQVPCRENSVFLIDWDDTLLASSWLASNGLNLKSETPSSVSKELQGLEVFALQLIEKCLELGKVVLCTNAEKGWVELSAKKWFPKISKILDQVGVISARTSFQDQYPDQPDVWKKEAYIGVFQQAFGQSQAKLSLFNVLSFGDSNYERNALMHLASKEQRIIPKSVKLIERPTVEQLKKELDILVAHLDFCFNSTEKIDLMLTIDYLE